MLVSGVIPYCRRKRTLERPAVEQPAVVAIDARTINRLFPEDL